MGDVERELTARLTAAFAPTALTVRNDSHRHAGHPGDDGSGESHFHVTLRSPAFAAMSRVDRHRAVQKAIGDLNTRIHALSLDIGA